MGSAQWSLRARRIRLLGLAGRAVPIGQHPVALIDVSPAGTDIGPVDAPHLGCVHGRAFRWWHIGGGALRQVAAAPADMRPGTAVRLFSTGIRGSGGTRFGVPGCGVRLGNGVVVGGLAHGPAVPVGA